MEEKKVILVMPDPCKFFSKEMLPGHLQDAEVVFVNHYSISVGSMKADQIYVFYQLEIIPDLDLFMNRIWRLLKDNGSVVFQSTYYSSIYNTVLNSMKLSNNRLISEVTLIPWLDLTESNFGESEIDMVLNRFGIVRKPLFKLVHFMLSASPEWSPQLKSNESVAFAQRHWLNTITDIIMVLEKNNASGSELKKS